MRNDGKDRSRVRELLSLWTALLLAYQPFLSGVALAAPEGAEVVNGEVSISGTPDYTVIEASDGAIIEYTGFDIGTQETVEFVQPSELASVLNRVNAATPTEIDGTLLANGQVYIVNPAGVIFGENAAVDVMALIAAAGNISNEDFLAGNDVFTGLDGVVENYGHIQADMAAFLGNHVANHGIVNAPEGLVMMVAGDSVLLGRPGSGYIKIDADAIHFDNEPGVENTGTIDAEGGNVVLAAGDYYSLAIRHTGTTRAQSIVAEGGDGGVVQVSGTLDASNREAGGVGGSIDVLGDKVAVHDALLDASGDAGGGSIRVGGDFQGGGDTRTASQAYVGSDAVLRADAVRDGDGGSVIVWSDQATQFYGELSARGGAEGGDGGFAEVSGAERLAYDGSVDMRAPAGERGTVLFDPKNITIADTGTAVDPGVDTAFDQLPDMDVTFSDESVEDALDGANLELQANNDIDVTFAIDTVGNGNTQDGNLSLRAGRSIDIGADVTLMGSFSATASDPGAQQANRDTGLGNFTMDPTATIDTTAANGGAGADISINVGPPGQKAGDATSDGFVGGPDFVALSAQFGMAGQGLSADFTGDGVVGGPDFNVLSAGISGGGTPLLQADALDAGTTGNVSLTGDRIEIVDSVTGNQVTIAPTTVGKEIDLGSEVPAALSLTSAELDRVTANVLHVGSSTAGNIGISTDIDPAGAQQLELETGSGGWILSANNTLSATDLALQAGVGIDVQTDVDRVEASTETGNLVIDNTGALEIGNVTMALDGVSITDPGDLNGGGEISVTASSPLTVNAAVTNDDGGDVTLAALGTAATDSLDVNANVSTQGGSGAVALYAGGSIDLDAAASVSAANAGSVSLLAGTDFTGGSEAAGSGTGTIAANGLIASGTGSVSLTADDGIDVAGGISTGNTTAAAVQIDADADANDTVGTLTLSGGVVDTSSGNGGVTVRADDFVASGGTIDAGSGDVTLQPSTAISIGVGDGATGDFNVSQAEIDAISVGDPGTLTIGDAALASPIQVNDVAGGARNIALATADGITDADNDASNLTTTGDLTLTSGAAIGAGSAQPLNVDVASVTVTGTGGNDVTLRDTGTSDTGYDVATGGAGTVRITQAAGNLAVGAITTTGTVSLEATNGAITDGDVATDVSGSELAARASTGIDLDTAVDTLAATTVSGSIDIANSGALAIGTVDGLSGVSITAGGPGDSLSVTAASPLTVNQDVSNTGGGAIVLAALGAQAGDDLDVNANVTATGADGNVTLYAGDSIGLDGAAAISAAGAGAVSLLAGTDFTGGSEAVGNDGGDVELADGSLVQSTGNGTITLRATDDVQVSRLVTDASTGAVVITADSDGMPVDGVDAGAITDAGAMGGADVVANTLAARAGSGIDLDTQVSSLEATSRTGAIDLANDGMLSIGGADTGLTGVSIGGGSDQLLVRATSPLTVSEAVTHSGTGTVILAAEGNTAADDLAVNADVSSGGGIELYAGDSISTASGVAVSGGNALVELTAGVDYNGGTLQDGTSTGSISMASDSTVSGTDRVLLQADQDIELTGVSGSEVDVVSTDGQIVDAGDAATDITADSARLVGPAGIGASDALETQIATLAAATNTGSIFLDNTGSLTIGSVLGTDGVSIADSGDANGGSQIGITAASPITVNEAVTNNDGGEITLSAVGSAAGDDLAVNANVTASGGTGAIDLNAGDSISIGNGATVSAASSGVVSLTAGTGTATGTIAMADGTSVQSGSGPVTLTAPGSIAVANVATGGTATITSDTGAIEDAGDAATDIVAATVDLTAPGGIGATSTLPSTAADVALELEVSGEVNADASGSGAAAGTTTVGLTAVNGTDLRVGLVQGAAGTALLTSTGGAIDDASGGTDLDVVAGALGASASTGIDLDTQVAALEAETDTGNIDIANSGGLTIGGVDAGLGGVILGDPSSPTNGGGEIVVTATSPITVNEAVINADGGNITLDAMGNTDADDLTVNANVTASGGTGAIDLEAGDSISLGNGATVSAASSGAVTLTAGTGTGTGTIAMADGTSVQSGSGPVMLSAPGTISVANVSTGGAATITSDTGAIEDAGDAATDVVADTASLTAPGGIGANDALEVEIGTRIDADASGSGAVAPAVSVALTAVNGSDLPVGLVQGAAGTALLGSTGGAITDADADADVDLAAGTAALRAATGIDLDTSIDTVNARSSNGNVVIDDDGALTVGSVEAEMDGMVTAAPNGILDLEAETNLTIAHDLVSGSVLLNVISGDPDAIPGTRLITFEDGASLVQATSGDIRINERSPLTDVPEVGTIVKADGDLTFDADNDFVTTTNQKIAAGGLVQVLAGNDITVGDVAGVDVNIDADMDNGGGQLTFLLRSVGDVRQQDGSIETDIGVDVVGNTISVDPFVTSGSGNPPFFYTADGIAPANVTASGGGSGLIFEDGSSLLPENFTGMNGEVLDYTGLLPVNFVNQSPPTPDELLNMTGGMLSSLNQVGAKTKPLWESELVNFIECSIFDEEDLEQMGNQVPEECRDFVAEDSEADPRFDLEPAVKARQTYSRLYGEVEDLRESLQGAANGYMHAAQSAGRPVTGQGFRAYVATQPSQRKALDYLNQLGELSSNVKQLSQSVDTQTGDLEVWFDVLVDDVTPVGLSPDEMMDAIDLSPPATASLAATDVPRSLR